MDDLGLLLLALSLISCSVLLRELMTNFVPLNEQVDATLKTMADAVAQLQVDFNALSNPSNDQTTVDAIIVRLKAGTDQLASAIATVQKSR